MISLHLHSRHPTTGAGLDLHATSGEITMICGGSGRGKSTLLGQIWGSRPLSGGGLWLELGGQRHDMGALSPAALGHWRPKLMAYVAQDPPVLKRDVLASWFAADDPRVAAGMADLELAPHLLARPVGEVSGGERQRFILLRAILSDCPILLLDEPFTGLDPVRRTAVARLLHETALTGRLVLLTAHEAYDFAQEILDLQ